MVFYPSYHKQVVPTQGAPMHPGVPPMHPWYAGTYHHSQTGQAIPAPGYCMQEEQPAQVQHHLGGHSAQHIYHQQFLDFNTLHLPPQYQHQQHHTLNHLPPQYQQHYQQQQQHYQQQQQHYQQQQQQHHQQQHQQHLQQVHYSPTITVSGSEGSSPCTASGTITPQNLSPQNMSPQNMSPQNMTPQNMSPQNMSPHHISPQHISSQHIPSENVTRPNMSRTMCLGTPRTTPKPKRVNPFQWVTTTRYPNQPNPGKTRTKDKYRVVYTDHQRVELEKEFYYSRYITIRRKAELANALGLSERQVKIWFQNRRAKERKQGKKRDEFTQKDILHLQQIQQHQQQQGIIDQEIPAQLI